MKTAMMAMALMMATATAGAANRDENWQAGWDEAQCVSEVVLDLFIECVEEQKGSPRAAVRTCERQIYDNTDPKYLDAVFQLTVKECD